MPSRSLMPLRTSSVDLHKLAAVSSDEASNFAGLHAGVQALIRNKYCPDAVFVHCRSHMLHLAAQRAAVDCKDVK